MDRGLAGRQLLGAGPDKQEELWVFQVMYDGALVVNAAIGLVWVVRSWRRGARHAGKAAPVTAAPGNVNEPLPRNAFAAVGPPGIPRSDPSLDALDRFQPAGPDRA